jgi:SAM-dependent methyltransferase
LMPHARVDCMGLYEDDRYRPGQPSEFHRIDLNEVVSHQSIATISAGGRYDLIVCMEVLEHLYTPPSAVLEFLSAMLKPAGLIFITTPNAAWLKNRIKLLYGKNPFEMLTTDRSHMGHVREYTLGELKAASAAAGLSAIKTERKGLYYFSSLKDRFYSRLAEIHPSLRRTLVLIARKE